MTVDVGKASIEVARLAYAARGSNIGKSSVEVLRGLVAYGPNVGKTSVEVVRTLVPQTALKTKLWSYDGERWVSHEGETHSP